MNIIKIQESCIQLFLIHHSANYWIFSRKKVIFSNIFDSEFSYIEVWFTD